MLVGQGGVRDSKDGYANDVFAAPAFLEGSSAEPYSSTQGFTEQSLGCEQADTSHVAASVSSGFYSTEASELDDWSDELPKSLPQTQACGVFAPAPRTPVMLSSIRNDLQCADNLPIIYTAEILPDLVIDDDKDDPKVDSENLSPSPGSPGSPSQGLGENEQPVEGHPSKYGESLFEVPSFLLPSGPGSASFHSVPLTENNLASATSGAEYDFDEGDWVLRERKAFRQISENSNLTDDSRNLTGEDLLFDLCPTQEDATKPRSLGVAMPSNRTLGRRLAGASHPQARFGLNKASGSVGMPSACNR